MGIVLFQRLYCQYDSLHRIIDVSEINDLMPLQASTTSRVVLGRIMIFPSLKMGTSIA